MAVPSQSLHSCAFALTSSSYFLEVLLLPPGSGVLRRSCSLFFFFEVFLSAFQITFSCRPFFFLGVEVWLGLSVFSPELGSVGSSLGSGKISYSVFVWSAGCPDPGTFCWCCGTLSLPCLACGLLGEVFCSVILSSACGFIFTAFSRQLAAISVLLVVSSTGCCLNGSVLCSSSSQLSFSFLANVCWGPSDVLPFCPLASPHSPFAALLLLFKCLCLLLVLCLTFSMDAASHF